MFSNKFYVILGITKKFLTWYHINRESLHMHIRVYMDAHVWMHHTALGSSRNQVLRFPGASRGGGRIRFDTWERNFAFSQRFGGLQGSEEPPGGLENRALNPRGRNERLEIPML